MPPSSRFKVARTASLPNTVPQSASTARMMSRFGVNMMIAPFRMKKNTLDINMILLYHVYVINITKIFIIINRQLVKCDKGAKM